MAERDLLEEISEAGRNGEKRVVWSVAGILAPDSETIGVWVKGALLARSLGVELTMADASPDLRELLMIAGVGGIFQVEG